jgi:hypothetical protein
LDKGVYFVEGYLTSGVIFILISEEFL